MDTLLENLRIGVRRPSGSRRLTNTAVLNSAPGIRILPKMPSPSLLLVLLFCWVGFSPQSQAQSVFPLPGWFRDNVGRPAALEKSKLLSDTLGSLSRDGRLGLTEGDAVRLVLENNLDVVVDRYDPRLALWDIERAYNLFDPKLQFTLLAGRSTDPLPTNFITGVNALQLGATSLLIVVGVAVDTMRQLEAQLMMRNYEGFIR